MMAQAATVKMFVKAGMSTSRLCWQIGLVERILTPYVSLRRLITSLGFLPALTNVFDSRSLLHHQSHQGYAKVHSNSINNLAYNDFP